jgi:hypothetical protein
MVNAWMRTDIAGAVPKFIYGVVTGGITTSSGEWTTSLDFSKTSMAFVWMPTTVASHT